MFTGSRYNISVRPHDVVQAACYVKTAGLPASQAMPGISIRLQWNFDGMHRCSMTAVKAVEHSRLQRFTTFCNVGNATQMELWMGTCLYNAHDIDTTILYTHTRMMDLCCTE